MIQGSACIYSKKVEYLYQLVLNALDLLAEKYVNQRSRFFILQKHCLIMFISHYVNLYRKKARAQTSSIVDGVDKDVEEEEEIEFLALDDIAGIRQSHRITYRFQRQKALI